MVPRAGVEPARPFGQRILSPLCGCLHHSARLLATDIDKEIRRKIHFFLQLGLNAERKLVRGDVLVGLV